MANQFKEALLRATARAQAMAERLEDIRSSGTIPIGLMDDLHRFNREMREDLLLMKDSLMSGRCAHTGDDE